MSDAPLIRKMRAADLDAALRLLARWNMAPVAASADIPDPERSGIAIENAFVAETDGRIVGVASYFILDTETAETASLAVDPDCQGGGVGHRLQAARLDEMRARGIHRVRTEADRPETIRWYIDKFGYRRIGTHPKKHAFSLPDVDHWTVLELDLTPAPPPSK